MFETKVGPRRRLCNCLSPPRNRPRYLRQLQEHRRYRPREDPIRHRPNRQGVPVRSPRALHHRSREFEQWRSNTSSPQVPTGSSSTAVARHLHRLARVHWPATRIDHRRHPPEDKLAFYSQATTDLMFHFPHGEQELWGIACRSDYDLNQHQEHSGKSMTIFDESTKEVCATTSSSHRSASTAPYSPCSPPLTPKTKCRTTRARSRNAPCSFAKITRYKAAVFPLLKNKPELVERAEALYKKLQRRWNVFYDASGAIGRRYRRQDEIGTPFGITIDFDTIEKDGTVTLRDRDTCEQRRVTEDELIKYLEEQIDG